MNNLEGYNATNEEAINVLIKRLNVDTNQISDGYHTFGELYEHRIQLFIALAKIKATQSAAFGDRREWLDPEPLARVWMTEKHSDDSKWEGWFILGINQDAGKQITYHLPISKWDECIVFAKILSKAPEWDGHTSKDVIERLKRL